MQRICGGYLRHYHANIYVMKHFVIPEITKLRMKKYTSWEKHEINTVAEVFAVSTRTLYYGPEAPISRSKAPLVHRTKQWHLVIL